MTNRLYAADHHFYHAKIVEEFEHRRPFDNILEHNEALVDNHNRVVGKDDVVYLAGDFILNTNPSNIEEYLEATIGRLNGVLNLIPGNHDTDFKLKAAAKYFRKIESYKEFKGFILSHIPLHESQLARFGHNVHGHVHSATLPDPRYINISMEAIDYTPISHEDIMKRIRSST